MASGGVAGGGAAMPQSLSDHGSANKGWVRWAFKNLSRGHNWVMLEPKCPVDILVQHSTHMPCNRKLNARIKYGCIGGLSSHSHYGFLVMGNSYQPIINPYEKGLMTTLSWAESLRFTQVSSTAHTYEFRQHQGPPPPRQPNARAEPVVAGLFCMGLKGQVTPGMLWVLPQEPIMIWK